MQSLRQSWWYVILWQIGNVYKNDGLGLFNFTFCAKPIDIMYFVVI